MVSRIIAQVLINAQQAQQQLDRLAQRGTRSFQNLGNAAQQASTRTTGMWTNMSNGAQGFANRINSVRFAFNSMAAAFGAGLGIQQLARASDTFILINNRIRQATNSASEHASVLEQLRQTSNVTGTAIENNATAFLRFNLVMDGLGKSASDTVGIIDTLNKAFVVNGTTTQEAQSVLLQLSQAFGAGALRGDEFRSVLENATFFARKLAEEMDVTVGDLKELAKEGKITTDVMLGAMQRLAEETEVAFGTVQRTIAMSVQELRNEFMLWAGEAGQTTDLAQGMADVFSSLAQNIEAVAFAMLGLIGLLTAGALGGALAGIVLGLGLIATVPGALTVGLVGLGSALAYFALRTTEAEKASALAAKEAKAHAESLRELDAALEQVNAGAKGSTEAFANIAKANLEAADAAVKQAAEQVKAQKALIAQTLIDLHGIEEAERRIREGLFDSTALDIAIARHERLLGFREEIARKITGASAEFTKTGKAAEEATAKIRVMHGTSIGATALIDAHGKLIRVTKGVGDEADKTSKKYKEQQEQMQKALDFIDQHEGATTRIIRGAEGATTVLFDELGRAVAQVDMLTGAISDLGQGYDQYLNRVKESGRVSKEAGEKTAEALTEAEKAQAKNLELFERADRASVKSAQAIKNRQVGLVTVLKSIWAGFTGAISRNYSRQVSLTDTTVSAIGGIFRKGVSVWGKTIEGLVGFSDATVKEMQPIFDDFGKWLREQRIKLGIGFTFETSLGEIIQNIQERLDKADVKLPEIPNPFGGGFFAELARQARRVKQVIDENVVIGPVPGGIWERMFPGIEEGLIPGINEIELFQQALERLKGFLEGWLGGKSLFELIFSREVEAGTGRKSSVDPLFGEMIEGLNQIITSVKDKWDALVVDIKDLFSLDVAKAIWENIGVAVDDLITGLKDKWTAFWEWLRGKRGEEEGEVSGGAGAGALPGGVGQDRLTGGGDLEQSGQAEAGVLTQLWENAKATIQTIVTGITSFVKTQFSEQLSFITSTWNTIKENVGEAVSALQERMAESFAAIAPALAEALEVAQATIAATFEQLSQAVANLSSNARSTITSAFQAAINAVSTAVNELVSVFQSAMSSISSAVNKAISRMKALEDAAKAAARAAREAAAAGGGSAAGGLIAKGMAAGGRIWGAGTSTSDSIWRRLSRGEYVIRSAAVSKYGQQVFDMLNSMALPKDFFKQIGMSMGGLVTTGPSVRSMPESSDSAASSATLFLELWQNGPVIETRAGPSAVKELMRHATGQQLRSLGKLPQGRG